MTRAKQLNNYCETTKDLLNVVAKACGHAHTNQFECDDRSTSNLYTHKLLGINYAGLNS